jgi:pimeloyl-ACP methyl ester carboxylesterase
MKKFTKISSGVIGGLLLFFITTYYVDYPSYSYEQSSLPTSFDEFYQKQLKESQAKGARPGNEERLVRYSTGKTKFAILYIHGFGASRAEGEYITDRIAKTYKANTYYLRLPGHGTNPEDHRDTPFSEYLKTAEDALQMMDQLGEKTVVFGTSMGGLITTYLASKYPEKITAIVLASPFYDFTDKSGNIYNFIWGKNFVQAAFGEIRGNTSRPENDPSFAYWYKDQYYAAIQNLSDLKRAIGTQEVYEKVTLPVLMLYYYKSQEEQDKSADVSKMLAVYDEFGGSSGPNPLSRKVQIENGNHVLLSEYVESDKVTIEAEIKKFLDTIFPN